METLVEIPVLDVFKGSETFWTQKFTGRGANISRGISSWHSKMDPLTKESRSLKHSESMVKYHSSISSEEREYNGRRISEGHRSRSLEEKLLTYTRIGEGSRRAWACLSKEEKESRSFKVSLGLSDRPDILRELSGISKRSVWSLYTTSEYESRCRSIAIGQMNMSEERKESWRQSKIQTWKDFPISEESRQEFSRLALERWSSMSPEKRNEWVSHMFRGNLGPNIPELLLGLYLECKFEGRFVYNGDGRGGFIIGGRIPDFVDSKNKIIIELFGSYWHTTEEEVSRKLHYETLGWTCFIVWDFDSYQETVLDRILLGIGR